MEDPDKEVRMAFSSQIKHILSTSGTEEGFIKEVKILDGSCSLHSEIGLIFF